MTSTWEDDSVRFAYVRFLATLPGNKGKDLELVYDKALPELADVDDKLDSETDNSRKFSIIAEKNGLKVTNTYYSFSVEDDSDALLLFYGHLLRCFQHFLLREKSGLKSVLQALPSDFQIKSMSLILRNGKLLKKALFFL